MRKASLLAGLTVACCLVVTPAPASPDAVVGFNEVQYNPPGQGEEGEWIELFNQMGVKVDLSGWRTSGVGYTFPQGTIIDPGAYLIVAKSPANGQLGPFTGSLDNSGERLRLYNRGERLMDELDFGDDGRWPAAADGSGATLAKRDPYSANKPPENWTGSAQVGGTPGTLNFPDAGEPPPATTISLLELSDTWRYNEAGADLGADWAAEAHPAGGDWGSGAGGLGSESGGTIPLGTRLTAPFFNDPFVVTYYFETEFELNAGQIAALQTLKLRHAFDDGAVIYLNGGEVLRVNMPGGVIGASTLALSSLEIDELSGAIPIAPGALVPGSNRISVEVHQGSGDSSDIVFGLELEAEITDALPGSAPEFVFNEMAAADAASFWTELKNIGASPVEMAGLTVSAAGDPLREYQFPAGQLAPGDFRVLDEETLGFRPPDGEKLFLYDATGAAVLDAREVTGRLRGRAELREGDWLYPSSASPGAENAFTFNTDIVISEIAYNPPSLPAVPPVPASFDETPLVELTDRWRYNASDADLAAGWAAVAHPLGGDWSEASAPIGRESSSLPVPLATAWSTGEYSSSTITYYFERDFSVGAETFANAESLILEHQIDDGAIFFLNGVEIGRFNMPSGAVDSGTLADPGVSNAELREFGVPIGALQLGTNRISVEVHQSSSGSSDLVFAAGLAARVQTSPAVPGKPFRNSDNQWLEIANRGSTAVDLGAWAFTDGIDFEFPPGTLLSPGEHACVVRDLAEFSQAFPGARILGEFDGNLSRTGERLLLRDAAKNPADVVRYFDSGRWPVAADGGGSTLELRDLDADNDVGQAWGASVESEQTEWKTYTYRGTAASDGGPTQWREFNMGLLDAGEILIDDIRVIEEPDGAAVQMLSNTDFESGAGGWRLRGNHRHSEVIAEPGNPGNRVLRLVATGGTGHMHNQVETTLADNRAVSNGREYEISFRALWVSGSNQLHTRLYFSRLARVTVIDRPPHVGSPSAPNTVAEANIGPTFSHMVHAPAVPAAGEAVTVTAKGADADGVSSMTLRYSVNGDVFRSVSMSGAGNGDWQASIPGQPAAAVVQFYIRAEDGAGAESMFPPAGPESRALYKVDDGLAASNGLHNFRIVLTNADRDRMFADAEVMSNDRMRSTIIDREKVIYYDVKTRLKGSQRARAYQPRVGFNMRFGADRPYRGIHQSMAIDRSEGVGSGQFEFLFDIMIANSGGIISRYYDLIQVITPTGSQHTRPAVLQMARYDDVFLDSQFEDGSEGSLYEYELIYFPTRTDGNGDKIPQGDSVVGTPVRDRGDDKEDYRWYFLKKNNREADDFEPMVSYAKHMSKSGAAFNDGLEDVVDVDAWLRGMAYAVLSGAGDNAGAGSQHNGMYYARTDGRVVFLPHDMDFAFDNNRSIFANPECSRLANSNSTPGNAQRKRIYFGHLHDIISTTWNDGYMAMWKTHLSQLSPSQNWNGPNSGSLSPGARANAVLSQIRGQIPEVDFEITTPSPLSIAASTVSVTGDGWVDVREIRVRGNEQALPVNWTDGNSWEVVLPAAPGTTSLTLEAVNFSGEVVGSSEIVIINTSTAEPASASNIAIAEIMYHPSDPTAAEVDAGFTDPERFEFIELMNIGPVLVDLTAARFAAGIDYEFPLGTTLEPGRRLVVARDRAAFLQRYPSAAGALAAAAFASETGLANGGERLQLVDAGGADIRNFRYDDDNPWPEAADGQGYSLVLIAPQSNPDHSLPDNWRPSVARGGNPGGGDAVPFVGDPLGDGDGDGMSALLEHALGSSDGESGGSELVVLSDGASGLLLRHPRNLAADDVILALEISEDMRLWRPAGAVFSKQSEVILGDGRSLVEWQADSLAELRRFVRLSATER